MLEERGIMQWERPKVSKKTPSICLELHMNCQVLFFFWFFLNARNGFTHAWFICNLLHRGVTISCSDCSWEDLLHEDWAACECFGTRERPTAAPTACYEEKERYVLSRQSLEKSPIIPETFDRFVVSRLFENESLEETEYLLNILIKLLTWQHWLHKPYKVLQYQNKWKLQARILILGYNGWYIQSDTCISVICILNSIHFFKLAISCGLQVAFCILTADLKHTCKNTQSWNRIMYYTVVLGNVVNSPKII